MYLYSTSAGLAGGQDSLALGNTQSVSVCIHNIYPGRGPGQDRGRVGDICRGKARRFRGNINKGSQAVSRG